jgi:hypothetical protein
MFDIDTLRSGYVELYCNDLLVATFSTDDYRKNLHLAKMMQQSMIDAQYFL